MKILYLTFYFEPDLCAGSFRNTPLVAELARQLSTGDQVDVVTTQPNRYQSFRVTAPAREERGTGNECRVMVERVAIPAHASGLLDQIRSFMSYYRAVHRRTKQREYDLIVASSSRLFTAFLGARLARHRRVPLFLDIRDLFREAILDVLTNPLSRLLLSPVLWAVERYTFGAARHINFVSEGFRAYATSFPRATYSYLTNGIDDEFMTFPPSRSRARGEPKRILYAGNIGEGQGLHLLIPEAARRLGMDYLFVLIGDGGARVKLERAVRRAGVTNVDIRPPVGRSALLREYQEADYLLVHLNQFPSLNRVLPSKLFEYGATDKPILAGVAGYAAGFVRQHLDNVIVFAPGDADDLVTQLRRTPYRTQHRPAFRQQFSRNAITRELARQVLGV